MPKMNATVIKRVNMLKLINKIKKCNDWPIDVVWQDVSDATHCVASVCNAIVVRYVFEVE